MNSVIDVCSRCGAQFPESGNFCSHCGTPMSPMYRQERPYSRSSPPPPHLTSNNPHHLAVRGFAQIFGIHPAIAFLTIMVDTMLFGTDVLGGVGGILTGGMTLSASLVFSCVVGSIVGLIAYKAQQKWYGDDAESAKIKAFILAFLVAIPTNIPAVIYVPAGIVGFFRRKKA